MARQLGRHEFEGAFDDATVDLLKSALNEAMVLAKQERRIAPRSEKDVRDILARGIINMAKAGLRDRSQLARDALAYLQTATKR